MKAIRRELAVARRESRRTKQPARRFKILEDWETRDSWYLPRRVIAKAEWTHDEANPRFLATSLNWTDDARYLYCARGDMENRIKECQTNMFVGRTSAASMRANQLRLWFAAFAYVLLAALRRIGLAGTAMATATCGTIRLKLLKIGALVTNQRAAHQACDGLIVSLPGHLRPRPRAPIRLRALTPRPPSSSHHVIRSSARGIISTSGQRARICATMRPDEILRAARGVVFELLVHES